MDCRPITPSTASRQRVAALSTGCPHSVTTWGQQKKKAEMHTTPRPSCLAAASSHLVKSG